ncbi:MAG: 50S ribosomal protein L32e [Nitrosarchaeum sp.]|nr:50S ribosomal protein L32e [Nitrosarchaeum sp.]
MDEALKKRNEIKRKKPSFRRHDSHKNPKLSPAWRRPKGLHNKVRLAHKGYVGTPGSGYRSPVAARGLHASGLAFVLVARVSDVEALDPKVQGAIVSAKVGDKRREEIVRAAEKRGVMILNKPLAAVKTGLNARAGQRKARREALAKRKLVAAKPVKPVKAAVKEELAAPEASDVSDEERKAAEKAEKDKVLTKKQ